MFNFHSINTLEINGSSQIPEAPELSIEAGEDLNALTWNSPYFTNFFKVYWSNQPFTNIDELGVHTIVSAATPGATPSVEVTYDYDIPAVFSLSVLYYRVSAFNANGEGLSDQVDSWNARLAIYEALYNKTIEELTLRFTPELRRQYQDSKLWRSFVQSLCSELAQSRFEIKEALKQLNLQKAINVFLNMWNSIIGISRINVPLEGSTTGEIRPETDDEYRQRLIDNVFWDKISNLALKKTLLLRLGYDADVVDTGLNPAVFREVPELAAPKYQATFGNRFIPHTTPGWDGLWASGNAYSVELVRSGPNSDAKVHTTGSTGTESSSGALTIYDYVFAPSSPPYRPVDSFIQVYSIGYSLLFTGATFTDPTQPPNYNVAAPQTFQHGIISMFLGVASDPPLGVPTFTPGEALIFFPSGATGTLVSSENGVLTFKLTPGSAIPKEWDWVRNLGNTANWLLTSNALLLTSGGLSIRPKLLSNTYSVKLGVGTLSDASLNEIYDEISPLAALGNVLIEILQDIAAEFNDWDTTLGNIPYGAIFFSDVTQSGLKSTDSNWSVSEEVTLDNQREMGSSPPDDGDTFYGNDGPDDIIILTRIT
jgi:hypothetical protein